MEAAFNFRLNHKVIPGTVCVGRFDGLQPCLVAAASTGKVLLHTPHGAGVKDGGRMAMEADVALLNVDQEVRALAAGCLTQSEGLQRDSLCIGTASHVLAYDVHNNSDLFYNQVPDGVNCLAIGMLGGLADPVILVGGNCAIQGFDAKGNDVFWTVTGDNVCSICLCDFDGDGRNELIVGSEDFDIRIYKHDDIVAEITETEAVTQVMSVSANRFVYALSNGTLGLYEGVERQWRIKSKNNVTSLATIQNSQGGVAELIAGWSSGKIDFRLVDNGEVLSKEQIGSCVAGAVVTDYQTRGQLQILVMSTDGDVCAYFPRGQGHVPVAEVDVNEEALRELTAQKQNLVMELRNYEENAKAGREDRPSGPDREQMGVIPANTQLQTMLYINPGSNGEQPCVELHVSTSNNTCVRCVMVFAEGIFPGESHVVHPNLNIIANNLKVQMRPEKDIAVDLHIKALVGYPNSVQYHVFELSRSLPRFSMFAKCREAATLPESWVRFNLKETPEKLAQWINDNFLTEDVVGSQSEQRDIDVRFASLRQPGTILAIKGLNDTQEVQVCCKDIELAGDVVQALAQHFGQEDLRTTADFPDVETEILDLMAKVNDIYSVRESLAANMADHSGMVKALLIRAEEGRLMKNVTVMKKYYHELYGLNQDLVAQHKVRAGNHQELLATLKRVNTGIQAIGRLRVGKFKTDAVNACRDAIKEGNPEALPRILKHGVA